MYAVGTADGGRRRLGDPEVTYLARLDQAFQGPPRVFDGHLSVDAMLVVQVDHVDTQPLKRRVARRAYVLWPTVDPDPGAIRVALVAELGGYNDLIPSSGNRGADEQLVGERTVHVGGVQQRDPEVQRLVDGVDCLALITSPVEVAHAHAAQSHGTDDQALPQRASLHIHSRSVGDPSIIA
jgi:hypothetical protein